MNTKKEENRAIKVPFNRPTLCRFLLTLRSPITLILSTDLLSPFLSYLHFHPSTLSPFSTTSPSLASLPRHPVRPSRPPFPFPPPLTATLPSSLLTLYSPYSSYPLTLLPSFSPSSPHLPCLFSPPPSSPPPRPNITRSLSLLPSPLFSPSLPDPLPPSSLHQALLLLLLLRPCSPCLCPCPTPPLAAPPSPSPYSFFFLPSPVLLPPYSHHTRDQYLKPIEIFL